MKERFNPLNFKAIETKYDGYKFRSRLEARWATFFNALDIPYEYEKEGYDLEGTWYLPDFWLPKQEYFIEIKGQEPTEEEAKKAKNLALYTNQSTHIISGNIAVPGHKNAHYIHSAHPPLIRLSWLDESGHQEKDIPTSLDARIAIQRLDELGMEFGVAMFAGGLKRLTIKRAYNQSLALDWLESQIELDIHNLHKLRDLMPLLKKCENELFSIFSQTDKESNENYRVYVIGQDEDPARLEWQACTYCNMVVIASASIKGSDPWTCPCCKRGSVTNDSPRLLAAYEAARQARF